MCVFSPRVLPEKSLPAYFARPALALSDSSHSALDVRTRCRCRSRHQDPSVHSRLCACPLFRGCGACLSAWPGFLCAVYSGLCAVKPGADMVESTLDVGMLNCHWVRLIGGCEPQTLTTGASAPELWPL